MRYFDDDDKHDLKTLVQMEKLGTAEDQNAMFARLAGRVSALVSPLLLSLLFLLDLLFHLLLSLLLSLLCLLLFFSLSYSSLPILLLSFHFLLHRFLSVRKNKKQTQRPTQLS